MAPAWSVHLSHPTLLPAHHRHHLPPPPSIPRTPNLPSTVPAIGTQVHAGGIRATIGEQENDGRLVLLDGGQTAQHVALFPRALQARDCLKRRHRDGRHDIPWADAVDADGRVRPVVAPFRRQVARHLQDRGLGRVVRARVDALANSSVSRSIPKK